VAVLLLLAAALIMTSRHRRGHPRKIAGSAALDGQPHNEFEVKNPLHSGGLVGRGLVADDATAALPLGHVPNCLYEAPHAGWLPAGHVGNELYEPAPGAAAASRGSGVPLTQQNNHYRSVQTPAQARATATAETALRWSLADVPAGAGYEDRVDRDV